MCFVLFFCVLSNYLCIIFNAAVESVSQLIEAKCKI